ncbi:hypothetical protein BD410DRAFT_844622 [Rickenella mellea]|uniref:Uncharacterized protein n=1 Tax=Rickenella mellea TaxID=50990 RepID=A0A4Y7PL76_9AGAM|nr:hypothetical protein BD410DRAFT_844622 [Rickenella mellea]
MDARCYVADVSNECWTSTSEDASTIDNDDSLCDNGVASVDTPSETDVEWPIITAIEHNIFSSITPIHCGYNAVDAFQEHVSQASTAGLMETVQLLKREFFLFEALYISANVTIQNLRFMFLYHLKNYRFTSEITDRIMEHNVIHPIINPLQKYSWYPRSIIEDLAGMDRSYMVTVMRDFIEGRHAFRKMIISAEKLIYHLRPLYAQAKFGQKAYFQMLNQPFMGYDRDFKRFLDVGHDLFYHSNAVILQKMDASAREDFFLDALTGTFFDQSYI